MPQREYTRLRSAWKSSRSPVSVRSFSAAAIKHTAFLERMSVAYASDVRGLGKWSNNVALEIDRLLAERRVGYEGPR